MAQGQSRWLSGKQDTQSSSLLSVRTSRTAGRVQEGVKPWMVLDLGSMACDILRVTGAHSLMDDGETGQIGEGGAQKGAVGTEEA